MSFEPIVPKRLRASRSVKVGLGMIKFSRSVYDAEWVSVEADKKSGKVRLTKVSRDGFGYFKTAHKTYNGISFSAIANYLGLYSQMNTCEVPWFLINGCLELDLSHIPKRKRAGEG